MLRPLSALALLVAPTLLAQSSSSSPLQLPTPTLRTSARIVVVDVVVSDKSGQPVTGLKQSDFALLENKSPQTLAHFEEHSANRSGKYVSPPPMPPGVFTNYVPAPPTSAVNILLLDTLNTPMQEQSYVRAQILKYLKSSSPGTRLAIFGLTDRLIMLQGFTSDPDLLRNAISKVKPKSSPLLDNPGGTGPPESIADQYAASGAPASSSFLSNIYDFEAEQKSFDIQNRTTYTLDAMNLLARYLAGIPGRKNLMWFSGAFPINIMADADAKGSPFAGEASSQNEFRATTNLLTRAQVAVYPIDALGVRTDDFMRASAGNSASLTGGHQGPRNADRRSFVESNFEAPATMNQLAGDTGGKAFFNTNGLAAAVSAAIDAGSNYYTLSYTPGSSSHPDAYRTIRVELAHPGYKLAYRQGYYAEAPLSAKAATAPPPPSAMHSASLFGAPPVTQIIFKAIIQPAPSKPQSTPVKGNATPPASHGPWLRYAVGYTILARQLDFTESQDNQRHAAVKILTLVYDSQGVLVNSVLNTVHADLNAAQYDSLLHTGLPYRQEISVPQKGACTFRLLVLDESSGRIGATEIPIAAIASLPALDGSDAPSSAAKVPGSR